MAQEPKHFDRRTMDRYLAKGLIKQSDVDSKMKQLPDDTNNAAWVNIDMDEAEVGEISGSGSNEVT